MLHLAEDFRDPEELDIELADEHYKKTTENVKEMSSRRGEDEEGDDSQPEGDQGIVGGKL